MNTTLFASAVPAAAGHFERDEAGRLVHVASDGSRSVGVVPVRAFPLSAPDAGVSIIDTQGHEILWLDTLNALGPESRAALDEDLRARDFRPMITRIAAVSTFATPSTWTVDTDHGATTFVLKAEEDIRRLDGPRLLIASSDSVCYEIKDRWSLDRASRRLLERFL